MKCGRSPTGCAVDTLCSASIAKARLLLVAVADHFGMLWRWEPFDVRWGSWGMRWRSVMVLAALLLSGVVADRGGASPAAEVISVDGAGGLWRVGQVGSATRVERVVGSLSWSSTVRGRWSLPEVAARHLVGGASADGSSLALVQSQGAGAVSSRFAVVRRSGLKTVVLRGVWSFDALSVDGRTLFLTESVGEGRYWVRAVDVATGRAGNPIVTKSITPTSVEVDDGPMEGLPMDRVVTSDGVTVFTLYEGPAFPFVHALDVASGGALCYELMGLSNVARLRLRFGSSSGIVDVRDGSATVAQIWTPSSLYGPSVRIAGTANAPR